MPVGRPNIGEGNLININWLSHDALRQQGPGRFRVTGCGKYAEIWTFPGLAVRPIRSEIQRGGTGLSYTAMGAGDSRR